ncbi:hypothetical protein E2C01_065816 [Portunus trituberculatus]|uniref:Uncharacterized protein n=1 Tax=Portunus trituberculatus TaxID=210409 RepID=A0A5B7HS78_PORTR|nr:hypothetical protein [Portunus trituberculatus]
MKATVNGQWEDTIKSTPVSCLSSTPQSIFRLSSKKQIYQQQHRSVLQQRMEERLLINTEEMDKP